MWWQTPPPDPTSRRRSPRPLAPVPEGGWRPPRRLPSLTGVHRVALDTETLDPELKTNGPGWARGSGHVVGISIALCPERAWYLPIRHEVQQELNLDTDKVLAWAREELPKVPHVIGANLLYDVGWLAEEGVRFPRTTKFYDVQYAEPLIDTTSRTYNLDALANKYVGQSKVGEELYRWCARSYGGPPSEKQRANIWRAPVSLVGPYAEADAWLPLQILEKQWDVLCRMELDQLFLMECRLIPLLHRMRRNGVRVDVGKAERVREELITAVEQKQNELDQLAGFEVNVHASKSLAQLFDARGFVYPRTKKGSPSFTRNWLAIQTSREARLVAEIRKLNKTRTTFVETCVLNAHVNGRLHTQFHPLRTDEGGAVSGRFSSSTPNLQFIPSRDPKFGPLLRSMFLPDEGSKQWRRIDYSQIEYRLFVHYSMDNNLIRAYQDRHTDFHAIAGQMLGGKLPRVVVKIFNFMTLYGAGPALVGQILATEMSEQELANLLNSLSRELGLTPEYRDVPFECAAAVQNLYNRAFPAARRLMQEFAQLAESQGYVKTYLGRRSQFPFYVPAYSKDPVPPLPYESALMSYGRSIVRAQTYKALNRVIQGSAADLMKMAMLECEDQGLYEELGTPHLTVHDETDHSDGRPGDPLWSEVTRCMEQCMELRVPILTETETGPNWGELKKENHNVE